MLPEELYKYIIVAVISYLLGSINTAILVSKLFYKSDVRSFGSGNAGATNMLRTYGKKAAALTLIGDALKGVLAALIGLYLAGNIGMMVGGFLSVLGHNWPVFFGFKGGKGILTSAAVVFTIDWRIGLILAVVAIGIMALTRYVSLGSIIGATLLPFMFYFMPNLRDIPKFQLLVFTLMISLFAIFRHRANILRLIQGKESKLGHKAAAQ